MAINDQLVRDIILTTMLLDQTLRAGELARQLEFQHVRRLFGISAHSVLDELRGLEAREPRSVSTRA